MSVPFKEIVKGNEKIRKFNDKNSQEEFNWHLDRNDRDITILKAGEGWGVQFDDELPRKLNAGDQFEVPAFVWHRVIRGSGDLVIHIKEK